jgi:hypothetical protein
MIYHDLSRFDSQNPHWTPIKPPISPIKAGLIQDIQAAIGKGAGAAAVRRWLALECGGEVNCLGSISDPLVSNWYLMESWYVVDDERTS